VAGHGFDTLIMRPDFANRSLQSDEWPAVSRQNSDSVSNFEITHAIAPSPGGGTDHVALSSCASHCSTGTGTDSNISGMSDLHACHYTPFHHFQLCNSAQSLQAFPFRFLLQMYCYAQLLSRLAFTLLV
jgi:hypothetical protein